MLVEGKDGMGTSGMSFPIPGESGEGQLCFPIPGESGGGQVCVSPSLGDKGKDSSVSSHHWGVKGRTGLCFPIPAEFGWWLR